MGRFRGKVEYLNEIKVICFFLNVLCILELHFGRFYLLSKKILNCFIILLLRPTVYGFLPFFFFNISTLLPYKL